MLEELFSKPIVVFCYGSTPFANDGFGPVVIEYLLSRYQLPEAVTAVDVGTSIGDFLFEPLLYPPKPTHVFILEAVSQPQGQPCEILGLDLDQLQANESSGFSLHQFPSVNLLPKMQQFAGTKVPPDNQCCAHCPASTGLMRLFSKLLSMKGFIYEQKDRH